jgi:hypothetical protein
MWLMIDVVGNHMGQTSYTNPSVIPFNSASDYHDCSGCPSDCNIHDYYVRDGACG